MALRIKNVLISEPVDPICANILQGKGINVSVKTSLKKEELLREVENYDGLVVRSATKVTSEVIEAAKNLCVIGRAGTGVDNIDCDAATRKGILVINAPGGNTLSAAELTCGMIVTLSRSIPQACFSLKSGKWDRKSFMGHELQGKTLAIIGLGRIGREVAIRMQSFGMTTIGFDPLVPPDVSMKFGVESYDLESIWPLADYITVHTPLIPQTKGLINGHVFSICKKGVKIVNCARGGIIDEDDLLDALNSGQCAGAGLDVYMQEPPTNRALIEHPKVICTPHLGASTFEAQQRVAQEIADQFICLMESKFAHGIVNSPTFCKSISDENCSWVSLCKSLGTVLASLVPEKIENAIVTLNVHGQELKGKENILCIAALTGFLSEKLGNTLKVNYINAPALATESGIKFVSAYSTSASEDIKFPAFVSFVANCGLSTSSVVGIAQGNESFLCAVNDASFTVPIRLSGNIILSCGKHEPTVAVKLLASILNIGMLYNISWSTILEGNSWCVINSNCNLERAPEEIAEYFNFWVQFNI